MFDFLKSFLVLLIGVGIFGFLLVFYYLKLKEKIKVDANGIHKFQITSLPIQTLNGNIQIKGIISFTISDFKKFTKSNSKFEEVLIHEFSNVFEINCKLKTLKNIQYMQNDLCNIIFENIQEYEKDFGIIISNLEILDYEKVKIN